MSEGPDNGTPQAPGQPEPAAWKMVVLLAVVAVLATVTYFALAPGG
jgi:hypothetical protein